MPWRPPGQLRACPALSTLLNGGRAAPARQRDAAAPLPHIPHAQVRLPPLPPSTRTDRSTCRSPQPAAAWGGVERARVSLWERPGQAHAALAEPGGALGPTRCLQTPLHAVVLRCLSAFPLPRHSNQTVWLCPVLVRPSHFNASAVVHQGASWRCFARRARPRCCATRSLVPCWPLSPRKCLSATRNRAPLALPGPVCAPRLRRPRLGLGDVCEAHAAGSTIHLHTSGTATARSALTAAPSAQPLVLQRSQACGAAAQASWRLRA